MSSPTGGERDIHSILYALAALIRLDLLHFFSVSLFFLSPRSFFLLTIFLGSILLVCFLSNNTAILAFIDEERGSWVGSYDGIALVDRSPSPGCSDTWLISLTFGISRSDVRPAKPTISLSTAQIPAAAAVGTDRKRQHISKEKTEIQLMTFSLFFLTTTYSLLFSLVLFFVCPSFIYLAVHLL